MVRLKNDFDALDELLKNEDSAFANTPPFVVEDERRDEEDLAAKTPAARFAALLNMMRYLLNSTIQFCGDTTRARDSLEGAQKDDRSNFFFSSSLPFLKGALFEIGFEALNFFFLFKLFFVPLKIQLNSIQFNTLCIV